MAGLPDDIEPLRKRLKRSDAIVDADRDLLLKFSDELKFHGYSVGRHVKLVQRCTMMAGDSRKYDSHEFPDVTLASAPSDVGELADLDAGDRVVAQFDGEWPVEVWPAEDES